MDDLSPAARALIDQALPPAAAALVRREVRPAVALSHAPAAPDRRSRLGGGPSLDRSERWPDYLYKPLSFLALIDLAEFAPLSGGTGLPTSGLLNLFYEVDDQPWGFDPDDRGAWRVIPADPASASPRAAPDGATTYPEIPLVGTRIPTIPDWAEDVLQTFEGRDMDAYLDLHGRLDATNPPGPRHQLGGWPMLIQNPWQRECQMASNGIDVGGPEGYEDSRAAALEAGVDDWIMLAQIDSDDDAGWMWGDVGALYFAMRRQDLAEREFDRAWLVLQCG
jgi:uncharacterized protein YwqG